MDDNVLAPPPPPPARKVSHKTAPRERSTKAKQKPAINESDITKPRPTDPVSRKNWKEERARALGDLPSETRNDKS